MTVDPRDVRGDLLQQIAAIPRARERVCQARFLELLVERFELPVAIGELFGPSVYLELELAVIFRLALELPCLDARIGIDDADDALAIDYVGPPRSPRWRNDVHLDREASIVPYPVAIGGLDPESIFTRREIRIGGSAEIPGLDPAFVEAFELIHVAVFLGLGIVERGKFEGDDVVLVGKLYLPHICDWLAEIHGFVELQKSSQSYWRCLLVVLYLAQPESVEAVGSSEEHLSIRGSIGGAILKLVALKTVILAVVFESLALGIEFRDSAIRTDPKESRVVFEDPVDDAAGKTVRCRCNVETLPGAHALLRRPSD